MRKWWKKKVPPVVGLAPRGVQFPQGEQVRIVDEVNDILVVSPYMYNRNLEELFIPSPSHDNLTE